ncbi:MAG: hypothetical protein KDK65_03745 [Chlamydiia bacterium]|nr:hypothetical protein [Chlamydiia bacterium]
MDPLRNQANRFLQKMGINKPEGGKQANPKEEVGRQSISGTTTPKSERTHTGQRLGESKIAAFGKKLFGLNKEKKELTEAQKIRKMNKKELGKVEKERLNKIAPEELRGMSATKSRILLTKTDKIDIQNVLLDNIDREKSFYEEVSDYFLLEVLPALDGHKASQDKVKADLQGVLDGVKKNVEEVTAAVREPLSDLAVNHLPARMTPLIRTNEVPLINIRDFSSEKLRLLQPWQIQALTTQQVRNMSKEQFEALTFSQWNAFTEEQIQHIDMSLVPPSVTNLLDPEVKAKFTPGQLQQQQNVFGQPDGSERLGQIYEMDEEFLSQLSQEDLLALRNELVDLNMGDDPKIFGLLMNVTYKID